jgi:hypothetical protein
MARRSIEHAVAVHQGITRALFAIDDWTQRHDGRWCFDGIRMRAGELFDETVGAITARPRQISI